VPNAERLSFHLKQKMILSEKIDADQNMGCAM